MPGYLINELSEQARAPHTNGPRDFPRFGALSLLQKLQYSGIQRNSLLGSTEISCVRVTAFATAPRPPFKHIFVIQNLFSSPRQ
jgi:hypothetical protein